MKKLLSSMAVFAALTLFVGGIMIGRGCDSAPDEPEEGASASTPGDAAATANWWTCAMHPQVRKPKPGKCPLCPMDLVPLKSSGDSSLPVLSMSEASIALANIQTSKVMRAFPEREIRMVGKIAYDETRLKAITARFPARIDTLHVNYTYIRVERGEHLAEVYSSELLTAQQELLSALKYEAGGVAAEAAREKLRLWGLVPEQIEGIVERGSPSDHFTLLAPMGGVVVEKAVKEGEYVSEGELMFRIADLTHLWVALEAYESDVAWLRYGQPVTFEVEAWPGETFEGKVLFVAPVVDPDTRTVMVRVDVPNPDGRLKPGMFVRAKAHSRIAGGGRVIAPELSGKWIGPMHPEIVKDHPGDCDICGMALVPVEEMGYTPPSAAEPPLLVPTTAVLRTGKRAIAYVALKDGGKNTFEGVEVKLGPRAGEHFIVLGGLEEGQEVVTNGAFKIDSSLQILARPSMMSAAPPGSAAEEGIDATELDVERLNAPEPFLTALEPVLSGYLAAQKALAADDLAGAKEAAAALLRAVEAVPGDGLPTDTAARWHEESTRLLEAARAVRSADTLKTARGETFEKLSLATYALMTRLQVDHGEPLYLMHCPMVYGETGASWLQTSADVANPYFGSQMLTCGEMEAKLPATAGEESGSAKALEADPNFLAHLDKMLASYFQLQEALAADDLDLAKQAADSLNVLAGSSPVEPFLGEAAEVWQRAKSAIVDGTGQISFAFNLDSARGKAFEGVSEAMADFVGAFGTGGGGDVYLLHCPMVYGETGANWLQTDPSARNPYFGASMLNCGAAVEQLVGAK